jgi:alkylation response protein AidB-like acyl-CoA dehydrogenase
MHFSFDDDQLAMRDAVRAFCAERLDLSTVAGREGKPADPATWSALADLGVLGTLLEDAGSDIGLVEATIAFEELGAHLVCGPVLWSTLAAPLVPGVASGDVRVAGIELVGHPVSPVPDSPVVVEHAAESDALLILREDTVELCAGSELAPATEGASFDPLIPVSIFTAAPHGEVVARGDIARQLRRNGAILSAALLVGVAQGALDVARTYALEREQFGVAIGSFQAVKHLLADMYVRVELARAATYGAAAIAAGRGAGDPELAAGTAKLLAGDAGIANGRTSVQVLGGMGFTWDMLPHYFLKRAWMLEHGFGTTPWHAVQLGTALGEEVLAP